MKRIYLFLAMASVSLFILVTCQKSENSKSDQIEEITFSKNFKANLTEANIWFEKTFEYEGSKINNQEIAISKEKVESFFSGYLYAKENEKHELYFKWERVGTDPLKFKLTAYITPVPKKGSSGIQSTEGVSDPPNPTHPPPKMT